VKLKELKEKVQKLHDAELANTKEFLEQAEERLASKKYDSAVYLATHVLETAEYLEHSETSEEAKKEIETMSDRAVQIIKESLPQVFESMSEKIKDELAAGNYTRLARFADNVGSFKLVSKKYNKKLYPQINDFNTKLETLKTLVKDIRAGRAVRLSMLRDLGLI
ncbi:hypothetical protein KY362_07920, partial [Candidatus Woesearchaeota archaeon]|nr:hypothetical protein [Candidatus Woesearchaeota archaeon]